jgi:hypothetical protein
MTIEQTVTAFLKNHRNQDFCDDCIAEQLHLKRRQQARNSTSALGTTDDFERGGGVCSFCGKTKKEVIRCL